MRMLALFLAFTDAAFVAVNAEISLHPLVNEAVVGQSTYFDCSATVSRNGIDWYHYKVGAKSHEDICLYCFGTVHPRYQHRIQVEGNLSTGTSRLNIKSVLLEDAGKYVCQEDGGIGDSILAELVVLESTPVCHTNIKPDGVLGPNSCNIEPDELQLSCSVSYNGNINPILQWRIVGSEDPIRKEVICSQIDNRMACRLAMNASFDMNGSSYICETTRSAMIQYSCSSERINILNVKTDTSFTEMVFGAAQTVSCSANSNQPCSYVWKFFDGTHEEVVSYNSTLTVQSTGTYKCEAECNIRDKQCTVLSKQVHVSKQKTESNSKAVTTYVVVLLAVVTVGLFAVGCFIYLPMRRIRNSPSRENLIA